MLSAPAPPLRDPADAQRLANLFGSIDPCTLNFADPQVRHLEMAQPVRSPGLGDLTILGHPVSHGARRLPIRTAAPELGQDNEEILTSIGYTKEQIADLAQRGII